MRTHHVESADTKGMVIHWAGFCDVIMKVMFLGRESRFRRKMLDAAALEPGQQVLDVGCGAGTLAVAASRIVGGSGRVYAVASSSR